MHAFLGALLDPRGVAGSHSSLATPAIDVLPAISARGRQLTIRVVTPTDTPLLTELIGSLSDRSRQLRFLRPITSMDQIRREAARVAERTPQQGLALVVIARTSDHERAIALGELAVDSAAPNVGEVADLVGDPYQREGIGRMLMAILLELAALRGIEALRATMWAENFGSRRLLRSLGLTYLAEVHGGELLVTARLDA
jgi:GNAT superfamily N-acetyltransferase